MLKRSNFEISNDGVTDLDSQINKLLNIINKKNKMVQTILSIAGKPGLYKLVSRGKSNLIVESLDETHKRQPVFSSDRVTSLADIAMFTEGDDVPLMDVLAAIRDKEEGKACSLQYKKASSNELREYFAQVLPNFDRDRVHDSDIRKLLQWYNILIANGISDFEKDLQPTEGDNIDDRKDQ